MGNSINQLTETRVGWALRVHTRATPVCYISHYACRLFYPGSCSVAEVFVSGCHRRRRRVISDITVFGNGASSILFECQERDVRFTCFYRGRACSIARCILCVCIKRLFIGPGEDEHFGRCCSQIKPRRAPFETDLITGRNTLRFEILYALSSLVICCKIRVQYM